MKRYRAVIIGHMVVLLWLNYTVFRLESLVWGTSSSLTIHLVFSLVSFPICFISYFVFEKFKGRFFRVTSCVFGAYFLVFTAYLTLFILNEVIQKQSKMDLSGINVIIGYAVGSFVLWLPVALVWYVAFSKHYSNRLF